MKKKLLYISYCFFSVLFTNCNGKSSEALALNQMVAASALMPEMDYKAVVEQIDGKFSHLQQLSDKAWKKIHIADLWNSNEGGKIKFYYDEQETLKQIAVNGYEESGEYTEVFILEEGRNILFNLRKNYTYTPQFRALSKVEQAQNTNHNKIADSTIIASYFDKNALILQRWNEEQITQPDILQSLDLGIKEFFEEYLATASHNVE